MKYIYILLLLVLIISCSEDTKLNCINKELVNLNIQGNVSIQGDSINIVLSKPYKITHKEYKKILSKYLFYKCLNFKNNYLLQICLDYNKNVNCDSYSYNVKEIKTFYQNEELLNIHSYILKEFKELDFYDMDIALRKTYKYYKNKDDIYNKDFYNLLPIFIKEFKEKKGNKASLTLLLTYGAFKNDTSPEMKNISKNIRDLWFEVTGKKIEIYEKKILIGSDTGR